MLKFLKTRAVSMQNTCFVSTKCSKRVCSFCNYYHFKPPKSIKYTILRHYVTDTAELCTPLKKKNKNHSKKYTELLEVTGQTASYRKTIIHKLNFAHISNTVGPNITLDKLDKVSQSNINKKTHTTQAKDTNLGENCEDNTNNLDNIHYTILKEANENLEDRTSIVEQLKDSGINDNTILLKNSAFMDTLHGIQIDDKDENQDNNFIREYKKSNVLIPFKKENDSVNSLSDHNLILHYMAQVDVYLQNGMPNRSFNMLLAKNQFKGKKILPTAVYNMLLETSISKLYLEKVFEIYKFINDHSSFIKPNAQTFAYMFQAVGMIKAEVKQQEIAREILKDMKRNNIHFDDILNGTKLNTSQLKAIYRFIHLAAPGYRMTRNDIDTTYKCKLLHNLKNNSKRSSPAEGVITLGKLQEMLRTQINMESKHELEVNSIAKSNEDTLVKQYAIERIAEWEKSWKSSVDEAFEKNVAYLKQTEIAMQNDLSALYPFLQVLPKEEYVNAILREIRQLALSSSSYSVSLPILYIALGKYIYRRYEFQRKNKVKVIDNIIRVYDKYLEWYVQNIDKDVNGRIKWQQLAHKADMAGCSPEMMIPEWPRHILINIGKFLYNIILNNVKIPHATKSTERQIPAFYILFRNKNNYYLTEEIKSHPYLSRIFNDSTPKTLIFETVLLPTCTPPRPWVDMDTGGFLFSKSNVVRDSGVGSTHLLKNTPTQQLYPVLDCLNQLGSIPWRINKPILDILIQIFREGGSEELNVPQSPSSLPPLAQIISELNEQNRNKITRLTLQHRRRKNEMYSLWCDCLYKLSVANHFRDKVFWLPHNLDFRGRAYPVPPHLTHLSSDLGRSILLFAQKKPLGPKGLDWLKIHTINLTGMKKRESLQKRLEYANEILDLIIDSARNPLTGKRWWAKSEEPWQTLAACMEMDKALQSPNPEEYVTGIAIHQDGSCNGLQHYAALGRDQIGAESVNLYPSDVPQDVYSVVALMVDEYRKNDADNGNEIAQALEGFVTRKVIKQTVMTTVYGVTKFGAKLQITRQLSDLKDFPQEHIWKGSLYLVELTFKSLRTMFESAKEIQDWFTDCARVISTRCDQYVQWVTPLGLPVLQPYAKVIKHTKNKNLSSYNVNGKTTRLQRKPDSLKQKNAFPPNFIHSLDSCHMMLTSLHCEQADITFMSVHDCFWTHPASVEIMNKICREQFIALHSEPILEDLATFLQTRYEKHFRNEGLNKQSADVVLDIFKKLPKKGHFDINNVLSSIYFFS